MVTIGIVGVSVFTHLISALSLAQPNITINTNQHYSNVVSYEDILICGIDNLTLYGKLYIDIDHYQYKAPLRDHYIDIYLAQDLPYFQSFVCKLDFLKCTWNTKTICRCMRNEKEYISLEINVTVNKIFSQNNVFVLMDTAYGVDFESNRLKFPVISDGKVKLLQYSQAASITKCIKGLVLEKDNLIVYGEAKFNNIFDNGTISFRYSVSKILLCNMFVHNCTVSSNLRCYCEVNEKNVFLLVLNVTASWSLRKAELTVLLKSERNESAIESQAISLPDIIMYAYLQLKLNDCPRILEEGQTVHCTCELDLNIQSKFSLEYSLRWRGGKWRGGKDNHGNRTTFSFTARRPKVEYSCLYNSTDKEKRILYSPFIIAKPENVTCNTVLGLSDELDISCVSTKMFPEALCVITLCQVETKVLKTLPVVYRNLKIVDNGDYYRSKCTSSLHVQQPGTYNMTVSLIPYNSGYDLEHFLHFAINKTFTFVKAFMNNIVCDNFSKQEINLTCWSDKIFPMAVCDFEFFYNRVKELKGIVSYRHTRVRDEPVYYKSICTLYLPNNEVKTGLYQINVSMFPATKYITVGETPHSDWTFEILIDKTEETTVRNVTAVPNEESKDSKAEFYFFEITIALAGVAAVFTISSIVACHKYYSALKRRKKNPNYDQLDVRFSDLASYQRSQMNATGSRSSSGGSRSSPKGDYLDPVDREYDLAEDASGMKVEPNPYAEIGDISPSDR